MDFVESPPVDIELGHDAEYYKDIINEYRLNPPKNVPGLESAHKR